MLTFFFVVDLSLTLDLVIMEEFVEWESIDDTIIEQKADIEIPMEEIVDYV